MKADARVILPNRTQMEFRASDLESLLPEGHRARLVWSYVVGQDLGRFYERIRVREGLHQLSGCAGDNLWKPEFGVGEVRDVVGNDGARPCGDRNFEHEVVAFVAEVRSPQVAHIDFGCDGDKVRCGGELECEVGSSLLTAQPPCGCR